MDRNEVEGLIRRWFEEVWNQRNDATIDELLDENIEFVGLGEIESVQRGRDAFKEVRHEYLAVFPDIHVTVDTVIVEGLKAVAWISCTATVNPTVFGRKGPSQVVKFDAACLSECRDGKFVFGRNLVNVAAIYDRLDRVENQIMDQIGESSASSV